MYEMKSIGVRITGISPLLLHRFPLEGTPAGYAKWSPEKQAEFATYRDPDTHELRVQSEAIRQSMIAAAKWTKGKGRASLKADVAAVVEIEPEWLSLGTTEYKIDTRSVVNATTKGRVLSHRPRLHEWALSLTLVYDPVLVTPAQLREVLDNAGRRIGIGDFRPENLGHFGKFLVSEWKSQD